MTNSTLTTPVSSSHALFGYDPSLPLAYVGGVLFSISALIHLVQYFKNRAWFMYFTLLGIFMEVAGYWTRVVAIKNQSNHAASTVTYVFSTLAPSFLAAGCYMTFGRIVYWVTPESHRTVRQLWVPARFVTIFFITWDILSFFVQCIGIFVLVGSTVKANQTIDQQRKAMDTVYVILRIGFIMQITTFGVFMLITFRFMFASKSWKYDWPHGGSGTWRTLAWTVVFSSILITGRSLYRCIEFTLHRGRNYLREHEWCFYLFDCVLILMVLFAYNIVHPGARLPKEYATIGHAYKKDGFRGASASKVVEDAQPTTGYSRVTLVPPPLAPAPQDNNPPQTRQHISTFTDPWASRPSPGAEHRY